jgi:HEAT repeat protein
MALAQYRSDGGLDYDSGWESCRRTADALVKIGCPAVEALTHALRSPEEWARGWTAWALGAIGSPAATDALIFGLFDPDEWVREKVIEALGKIGDPRAVEPLTRILPFYYASFSSSYGPRDALANIGAPAVEYLITALCDRNHWVRWHATDALGMIGDTRAVDPLLSCLHDPDAIVRTRAAQALGTIGDVRALEPLIAALHDPEANVADATREAIGAIRQRTCEPGDETSRVHHDDPQ